MRANLLAISQWYLKNYHGLSRACWAGIAVSFIQSVMIGIYYYLSSYFTHDLHLAMDTSGYILSCYGAGAVAGSMLGGLLTDRYTPGMIAAGCLLAQACAYLLLVKFTTVAWLMANVGLLGLATYGFMTANYIAVLNTCRDDESQRLKVINVMAVVSNLGLGVAAFIISATMRYGYHDLFAAAGVILLMISGWMLTREFHHSENHCAAAPVCDQQQANISKKAPQQMIFVMVLVCVFLIGLVVTQFGTTTPVYMQTAFPDLGVKAASTLFALNALLVVALGVPLGNYFKQYNKVMMVGVGALLMGLSMCMLGLAHIFTWVIAACILYTIGEIIFFSMAQLVCYQNSPTQKRGRSLGAYRMIYAASRIAGPSVGGFLLMRGGVMLWLVCGLLGVISFVLCWAVNQFTVSAQL